MIRSHPSAVMSRTGVNDSMPALVTRISTEAELRSDLVEAGGDRRPVGDVDVDGDGAWRPPAQLVGRRLGRGSVAVEDGDPVAVGGEPAGDAEADPRCPAGDDGDPAHRLDLDGVELEVQLG